MIHQCKRNPRDRRICPKAPPLRRVDRSVCPARQIPMVTFLGAHSAQHAKKSVHFPIDNFIRKCYFPSMMLKIQHEARQ